METLFQSDIEANTSTCVKSAILSDCRKYRYVLKRSWGNANTNQVIFIGLNPSTADEYYDDPTVRRCTNFAKKWGYSSLAILNLFAYRSKCPRDLLKTKDPVGKENDYWLKEYLRQTKTCVIAWGTRGVLFNRDTQVLNLISDPFCFGKTKSGAPLHPLYLSSKTELTKFT